jgi:hypothetical protein
MDINSLVSAWKAIDVSLETETVVNDLPTADIEAVKAKLARTNVHFVAQRQVPGQEGQVRKQRCWIDHADIRCCSR